MCKGVGVKSNFISETNVTLPFSIVAGLFEAAAKTTHSENFGLLLSEHQGTLELNKGTQLMLQYDTLGEALAAGIKYYDLHSTDPVWHLQVEGKRAWINRLERLDPQVNSHQYTAFAVANCCRSIRSVSGERWQPEGVSFSRFRPDCPHLYHRHFGVTVQFDQEFNRITFSAKDLQKSIIKPDWYTAKKSVDGLLGNKPLELDPDKLLSRIRALVRQSIHKGNCQSPNIATSLGMHSKKLQRVLRKMGTSFQTVRSQTRLDEAEYYLKNSNIPLTLIAEILGYSEASALSRAFKERHGIAPSNWRKIEALDIATS